MLDPCWMAHMSVIEEPVGCCHSTPSIVRAAYNLSSDHGSLKEQAVYPKADIRRSLVPLQVRIRELTLVIVWTSTFGVM